jgi:23S rRNA (adenine2503-C2)-methyltransferase
MRALLSMTSDEVADVMRDLPGRGAAHALYRSATQMGRYEPESLGLSAASVCAWRRTFEHRPLIIRRRAHEPSADGRTTEKVVLGTHDGYEVECVRIPMGRGRTTLCVSSQVGCRLACAFCETGKIGLVRHLTADEIVGQVVTVHAELGWPVEKIVFMGMGEPLDNVDAVMQALRVLHDRRGFALGQAKLTICTAGHVAGLAKLQRLAWPRLNLSVSLNAATDEKRNRLMPINRRVPLAQLQQALIDYRPSSRTIYAVNYCLLPGFNDGPEDADAVAAFCRPLGRLLVNVIPYNPGSKPLTRAPTEAEVEDFMARLQRADIPVQRRRTKGQGVMAACGQLGNVALRPSRQRLPVYDG